MKNAAYNSMRSANSAETKVASRRFVGSVAPCSKPPRRGERKRAITTAGTTTARESLRVALATPLAACRSPAAMLLEMNLVAAEGSEPDTTPTKRAWISARTANWPTSTLFRMRASRA